MKCLAVLLCALVMAAGPAAAGGLSAEQRLALEGFRAGRHAQARGARRAGAGPRRRLHRPRRRADDARRLERPGPAGQLLGHLVRALPPARCRRSTRSRASAAAPTSRSSPIATGRNSPEAIAAFREEAGIGALATAPTPRAGSRARWTCPACRSPSSSTATATRSRGMLGDADWDGPEARALIDYSPGSPAADRREPAPRRPASPGCRCGSGRRARRPCETSSCRAAS